VKRILTSIGLGLQMISGVVILGAGLIACGAVRQTLSFSECAAGKPEMSLTAFAIAGFGGSVCSTGSDAHASQVNAELLHPPSETYTRLSDAVKQCVAARKHSPQMYYSKCLAVRPLVRQQIAESPLQSQKDGYAIVGAEIEVEQSNAAYEMGRISESDALVADANRTLKGVMTTTSDPDAQREATALSRCYVQHICGNRVGRPL
jgi:hypothetical protein